MIIPRFLIIVCCCLPAGLAAQQADPIGVVLLTKGLVQARDSNGTLRDVQRRSRLYSGDSLITRSRGFIQLRMADSAVIALGEETEFTFHEYAIPDRAIMELHRGKFRSITGNIHSNNQGSYKLMTPDVDVVPDGTAYECALEAGKTFCGVYDGGINVSNSAGTLNLGIGGNFDYMEAIDRQTAPVGLMAQPAMLGRFNLQSGVQQQPQPSGPQNVIRQTGTNAAVGANPPANSATLPQPQPIRIKPYKKP